MSTVQVRTELFFDELLHAVEQLNLPDLEKLRSRITSVQARRKAPSLSRNESKLLLKINQGLSPDVQMRFDTLVAKRQAETIAPNELQELIILTDQIEESDAERAANIAKLAQIRGVSFSDMMEELAIRPPAYA